MTLQVHVSLITGRYIHTCTVVHYFIIEYAESLKELWTWLRLSQAASATWPQPMRRPRPRVPLPDAPRFEDAEEEDASDRIDATVHPAPADSAEPAEVAAKNFSVARHHRHRRSFPAFAEGLLRHVHG